MHNLQELMNFPKDKTTSLKISLEPIQEEDENEIVEGNFFKEKKTSLSIKANEKSIHEILPDTSLVKKETVLDASKENIVASNSTEKIFIKLNAKKSKQEKNHPYRN